MPLSSPDIPPVQEGDVLDGKYRVDRVLGVGGMGIVVAATHIHLNQRVALKFLLPAAVGNREVIERFAREARAAVQIQSEHVARVTDVGTLPTGSPYMVMEYLEGTDLAQAIEKGGPMPVTQAVGYVLQACEAIAEAHALGIVHRDLKPANLFLARRPGRDPMVKVLDFGISKTSDAATGLTQTSSVMGSPFYMAPEQMMSSKDVDARADLWALGVIAYELLAGKTPFAADTMPEVVYNVTQRDPAPVRELRPDVPEGLAEAIARCLARDRAQRYPNVARLAAALAPFGPPRSDVSVERISRVLGASIHPPEERDVRAPATMQGTSSTWAKSGAGHSPPGRTRFVAFAVAGAVVLLVGVGVLWRALRPHAEVEAENADRSKGVASVAASAAATPPASTSTAVVLAPLPETSATATPPPPPAALPVAPSKAATAGKPAQGPGKARVATTAAASVTPPAPTPAPAPAPARGGLNMGMKE
jgi:serine/threonine protein kinase